MELYGRSKFDPRVRIPPHPEFRSNKPAPQVETRAITPTICTPHSGTDEFIGLRFLFSKQPDFAFLLPGNRSSRSGSRKILAGVVNNENEIQVFS
jgi:hypothetical protein